MTSAPSFAKHDATLTNRTAALRAVRDINADHNRAASCRDISMRARISPSAARREFTAMIFAGLAENDEKGAWLTDKGLAVIDRDRPLRVPEEMLVTNSEWKD